MVRIPPAARVASILADDDVVIAGAGPEHSHEEHGIAPEAQARGSSFTAAVDVIEWVGSVQFAW